MISTHIASERLCSIDEIQFVSTVIRAYSSCSATNEKG